MVMIQTDKTRRLAKQAISVVTAHTALYVLFTYTHGKIDELFLMTDYMPVFLILCFAPMAAVIFLSTESARQGAVILLGILPAELMYNIYTRFTASTPFNIQEPAPIWKILYEGSFGGILVLEVVAFWLTLKALQEVHKQLHPAIKNPTE